MFINDFFVLEMYIFKKYILVFGIFYIKFKKIISKFIKNQKMIQVICAIILKDNKILVTQRSEKMSLPLKWEFPGGKLEIYENEIDCIKREIKEELNIEIEVLKRLSNSVFDYGTFKINLIPFIAKSYIR